MSMNYVGCIFKHLIFHKRVLSIIKKEMLFAWGSALYSNVENGRDGLCLHENILPPFVERLALLRPCIPCKRKHEQTISAPRERMKKNNPWETSGTFKWKKKEAFLMYKKYQNSREAEKANINILFSFITQWKTNPKHLGQVTFMTPGCPCYVNRPRHSYLKITDL